MTRSGSGGKAGKSPRKLHLEKRGIQLKPGRTLKLLGCLIMLAAPPLATAQGHSVSVLPKIDPAYEWYWNARYAYAIPYPSKLLFPDTEGANAVGADFVSKDKKTSLSTWADYSPEVLEETLKDQCKQDIAGDPDHPNPRRKVNYTTLHENWCVVSGTDGDNIFYQKRYLIGGQAIVFVITYPAAQRKKWDKVAAYISKKMIPDLQEPNAPDK